MPPIALAQVDTVYPDEGRIAIIFPNNAMLSGLRVRIAIPGATADEGTYTLPQRGDWGLVAFYQNDPRSCVWVQSVNDDAWNSWPAEILMADPEAEVTYTAGGVQHIHWGEEGDADTEHQLPDGTMWRITHGKDGSLSNVERRARRTPWLTTQDHKRGGHTPRKQPPADFYFRHTSGTTLILSADGSLRLTTAKGHTVRMHDATEKRRDGEKPYVVMDRPEEDAKRVASEIEVRSESGLSLRFHDDPVLEMDRYLTLTTPGGHHFTLRDKGEGVGIEAVTAAGLRVKLDDQEERVTVKAPTVEIDAGTILLGKNASRRVVLEGDPLGEQVALANPGTTIFGK